jgi:hypothetical protein
LLRRILFERPDPNDAAIKCRYCGSELPAVSGTSTPLAATTPAATKVLTTLRVGRSTDCPHCAHTVSVGDAACAHCQTCLTWLFEEPPSALSRPLHPIQTIVALGFAFLFVYWISGAHEFVSPGSLVISSTARGSSSGNKSNMAFIICKDFVKQRLKAPASADFPWLDFNSRSEGSETYSVTSYVAAEDGFGAKLRNAWSCRVGTPAATGLTFRTGHFSASRSENDFLSATRRVPGFQGVCPARRRCTVIARNRGRRA